LNAIFIPLKNTMGNYMESKVNLGEYIRSKRESLNISQQAVAYKLGMSQPAYSKIERGETEVKVSQLYKIAACMHITIYELLPEAVASDVMGDYLLAPVVHRIRKWWFSNAMKKTS